MDIYKFDGVVKSQIQRICHFDRREKSYIFNALQTKDFSLRHAAQASALRVEMTSLGDFLRVHQT